MIVKSCRLVFLFLLDTAILAMHVLRALIAPGVRVCRYSVSCTEYAEWQLRNCPLHKAFVAIIWRLLSCHPFQSIVFRFKRRLFEADEHGNEDIV